MQQYHRTPLALRPQHRVMTVRHVASMPARRICALAASGMAGQGPQSARVMVQHAMLPLLHAHEVGVAISALGNGARVEEAAGHEGGARSQLCVFGCPNGSGFSDGRREVEDDAFQVRVRRQYLGGDATQAATDVDDALVVAPAVVVHLRIPAGRIYRRHRLRQFHVGVRLQRRQ